MPRNPRSAFTLIELLVVIAIIAVLSVILIIILNPTEILAQGRDNTRLADLATLKTTLGIYRTNFSGSTMGLASTTYTSIPGLIATTSVAGDYCQGVALPIPSSSWNYHCAASSTYANVDATGWVPLDFTSLTGGSPISGLPIDPVNTAASGYYYTYTTNGSQYTLTASLESQKYQTKQSTDGGKYADLYEYGTKLTLEPFDFKPSPALGAWVPVPGNATFGTSNFYVMKYDAVCSDGNGNYLNDFDTGYHTYNNSGKICISANGRAPASLPGGWPIVNVQRTIAATYCTNIGAHLITNNEWQTIAWNAENVASNWSGGSVGSGYIYSGHNDNQPALALPADSNDANGYSGETNQGGNQRRTLTLSNGSVVWDMAGNVWEWTNDTITGTNEPNAGAGAFAYHEFTALTTYGSMTQQTAGPVNSAWNSSQGIGQVYSEGATDATIYSFYRGGGWHFGSSIGVDTLQLDITTLYTNLDLGFRCAQ